MLIAGGTLVVLVVIVALAASPRLAGRFEDHENWMRFIGVVHVGVDRLRRDPRDAMAALVAAFAYQLSVVAAVYCAVHVIDLRIPNGAVLAFIPAVAMAQVLPISVGGLGRPRGYARVLAASARRADGPGRRGRPALVRDDAHRQPARRAGVRGRPRAAGTRRPGAARSHRDGGRAAGRAYESAATAPGCAGASRRRGRLLVGRDPLHRSSSTSCTRRSGTPTATTPRRRSPTRCDLIHWQQLLGINHEQLLQSWALHFKPIIIVCNYFYGSLHFVVTGGVMVFLYRKCSDDYPTWRNTLAIATAIALIGFTLFPLMPPRLLDPYSVKHHLACTSGSSTRSTRTRRSGRSTRAR